MLFQSYFLSDSLLSCFKFDRCASDFLLCTLPMNCLMNALLKLEKLLMLLAGRRPNHLEARSPKVCGNVKHKRPSLDAY